MFGFGDKINKELKKKGEIRAQEIYWEFLGTVPVYELDTDWNGYVAFMANTYKELFSQYHPSSMFAQFQFEIYDINWFEDSAHEGLEHKEYLKWESRQNPSFGKNADSAVYFEFAAYCETCVEDE